MATLKRKTNNGYEPLPAMVVRKTNAENGSGIGTCSTSSGTALTVSLTGYELVTNGFVAVTFSNDVPANATLNVNGKGAKPIYYKGSAIEADVIMADDTAIFSYDGTNYVLCSSGAGGAAPVNPNETVNISLTQVGGNSADLIGASITITDDISGDTIYTSTWDGITEITTTILSGTYYTVSVSDVTGYSPCVDQSFQAVYQINRDVIFQYRAYGAYIEATDGSLYTSEQWSSAGKTVNSIVLMTETFKCRIPTTHSEDLKSYVSGSNTGSEFDSRPTYTNSNALTDYNGKANTSALISLNSTAGTVQMIAGGYVFPAGQTGYLPACGELHEIMLNTTSINTCITAVGGNILRLDPTNGRGFCSSTKDGIDSNTNNRRFYRGYPDGGYGYQWVYWGDQCLPIGSYV